MSIKSKKTKKLYVTGSSGDITGSVFYISSSKEEEASSSFAKGSHIRNSTYFNQNKAVIYQLKLIEQDIDEIHEHMDERKTDVDGGAF